MSRISRRRLLLGAASAGIGLPLLPSLMTRSVLAQSRPPKRFIFLFHGLGIRDGWYPSDDRTDVPWRVRDADAHVRDVPLADIPGDRISDVFGPELNPFRDKLTLLRGLDLDIPPSHYWNRALSGQGGVGDPPKETIDQVMVRSGKLYESAPMRNSIHLIARGSSGGGAVAAQQTPSGAVAIQAEDQPWALFDQLFGGEESGRERRLRREQALVDRVRRRFDALRSHPRISPDDSARLESHLDHVRDIEARLHATVAAGCVPPLRPEELDRHDLATYPESVRDNLDLLIASIRCDVTRVATFQFSKAGDNRTYPFLDIHTGVHGLSHRGSDEATIHLNNLQSWYAAQLAYLMEQLDVVEDPETGATYLDNTAIFWGSEFGLETGSHYPRGMPAVLAGGGALGLDTGRYIDYRELGQPILVTNRHGNTVGDRHHDDRGRYYNDLLVSLMLLMGLDPADWEGDEPGFGDYGQNLEGQYPVARRDPLPFLMAG